MKPYPNNIINFSVTNPVYINNEAALDDSRYSVYQVTDDYNRALEVKIDNQISSNKTYRGYYYTATKNETLYEISKRYYGSEDYYWILAKVNNLRNDKLAYIKKDTTLSIPNFDTLYSLGGYFNKG